MTLESLLTLIPLIVTAASAIAAVTPTPADDKAISFIYKILDALALNLGYAKQKPSGDE